MTVSRMFFETVETLDLLDLLGRKFIIVLQIPMCSSLQDNNEVFKL
jgi:hypothetical protein